MKRTRLKQRKKALARTLRVDGSLTRMAPPTSERLRWRGRRQPIGASRAVAFAIAVAFAAGAIAMIQFDRSVLAIVECSSFNTQEATIFNKPQPPIPADGGSLFVAPATTTTRTTTTTTSSSLSTTATTATHPHNINESNDNDSSMLRNPLGHLRHWKRESFDNTTVIDENALGSLYIFDPPADARNHLPAPQAQVSSGAGTTKLDGGAAVDLQSGVAAPPQLQGLAKQQLDAFTLAQEANRAANILNAELCRNFSIGLQYETGGVFTSPDYPNPYPLNLICTRLIEAPVGHYIVLEFRDQFNIEEAGTDCDSDKIEIRDGRYGYSKVLARYCGTKFPPEVRSTNEAMWLRFISDSSITHNGFKAVYRFEKQKNIKPNPPFECRFNVTAMSSFPVSGNNTENRTGIHSGVIRNTDVQSQLLAYSKEFNVSLECIWNITVMPGWKIYLTFSNYELNKPNDCDSNFIEIYEENLTEENQTVKFCGTRTEPQQSKSNIFNIRHHALPSASGSRFEIIYTAFRDKGVEGCDAREFDCDDGTCIHESLKCDGQVNCKYRYDEASDPGPCQSGDPEGTFFETEHMVIILIVFLTLVGGMCASIIVSCWGKIQERRRRKLEYHMRKSREASMEGQLNKAGQIIYGPNDARPSGQGAATSVKQRHLAAPIMPAENAIQQQINSKYALENQANGSRAYLGQDPSLQQLPHGVQYQHQQQKMMAMDGGNYGIYGQQQAAGGGSQDDKQMSINKSLQNIQQSMLTSLASQNAQQQPQQVGDLSQLQQQQSVPDISYNNQFKMQSVVNDGGQLMPAGLLSANEALAQEAQHLHQQQMLNISLTRNHLNQQQQHQQKLSNTNNPIYQQQQQHQLDNNSTSNGNSNSNTTTNNNNMSVNQYSRYLRHQQNVGGAPLDNIPGGGILNQPASAQTMPISLAKYNTMIHAQLGAQQLHQQQQQTGEPGQQLNYDTSTGSQFATAAAYNPQRALTLSTMHQPLLNIINNSNQQQQRNLQAIYGIHPQSLSAANNNNLSSSVTCCNLSADCMDETPLIGDLLQRASQQQQQRVQFPQNNRIYELRSTTLDPRSPNASIPRSISAHQLSRAQLRQSQNQQRQQQAQHQAQQQQQQQQQQQRQQQQLPYKSISDAGHANRHQPPNHSLSYPHACTGSHLDSQQRGGQQSPALPPPPPPPNLMQARSQTACGSLPVSQIHQTDSRRAAFKVSRLDQSQLTGDTMQDSDMLMANMPLGSMQFDEPSTESDGTFGVLMNPLGKQHLRQAPQGAAGVAIQAPQALYLTQGIKAAAGARMMQPQRILSHLSDCNLIRHERSLAMNARPSDVQQQQQQQQLQSLICNCGALDRANSQLRQQQLQQAASSSHEFDDSDDVACMVQPGNLASLDIGTMMNTIGRQQQQQHQQLQQHSGLALQQQQQYARFRQQSSELTGEDDDEDDEEMGGYNVDQDDEPSSDALVQGSSGEQHASKVIGYRTRPVVRNEELRDAPGRHLSGSHTSISCQSCTCGSQLRLDQAGAEDESSEATKSNGDDAQDNNNNNTIKNNEVMIDNVAKVQEKTPRKDARAGGGQVASREKGSRAEMTASASLAGSTNNE